VTKFTQDCIQKDALLNPDTVNTELPQSLTGMLESMDIAQVVPKTINSNCQQENTISKLRTEVDKIMEIFHSLPTQMDQLTL